MPLHPSQCNSAHSRHVAGQYRIVGVSMHDSNCTGSCPRTNRTCDDSQGQSDPRPSSVHQRGRALPQTGLRTATTRRTRPQPFLTRPLRRPLKVRVTLTCSIRTMPGCGTGIFSRLSRPSQRQHTHTASSASTSACTCAPQPHFSSVSVVLTSSAVPRSRAPAAPMLLPARLAMHKCEHWPKSWPGGGGRA
jgi:hypothetical protein